MTFHSVGNFIIPSDELIFFRGIGILPTRYGLSSPQKRYADKFRKLEIEALQGIGKKSDNQAATDTSP